jgi:molybdopterin-biosynthesis enzyme MoeA-like protein
MMAGVPHITAGMLDALSGTLEGGKPLVSVTVGAFAPESEVADLLRQAEQSVEGISIGSYPFFKEGKVGSNFVIRSEDPDQARAVADELAGKLAEVGYQPVAGGI